MIASFHVSLSKSESISFECHSFSLGKFFKICAIILLYIFSVIPSVSEYLLCFDSIRELSLETYVGFVI